ncbi:MAG: heavy-metal-associated domain-containing protein [Elusimicrobia bacterium]|nr:heavy-metal-associated domain-containing protein [Elusimicrobiota bacterium]
MPRRAPLLLLALLLLGAGKPGKPGKPDAPPVRKFADLKSGVYACALDGMMCTACAGMVAEEVRKVAGVEKAEVDFDARVLRVVIAPKKTVRVDNIKRALARAARRIDLGTTYVLGEIRYIP